MWRTRQRGQRRGPSRLLPALPPAKNGETQKYREHGAKFQSHHLMAFLTRSSRVSDLTRLSTRPIFGFLQSLLRSGDVSHGSVRGSARPGYVAPLRLEVQVPHRRGGCDLSTNCPVRPVDDDPQQSTSCYRDSTACVPRLFSAVTGATFPTHLVPVRSDPPVAREKSRSMASGTGHRCSPEIADVRFVPKRSQKRVTGGTRTRAPKSDLPGRRSDFGGVIGRETSAHSDN
jgi:hypothetical protein